MTRSEAMLDDRAWRLHLWDEPSNAKDYGRLGVHETRGPDHVPVGHVFLGPCNRNNELWTVAASHEAIEMVGDEWVNLDVARHLENGATELWPRELCDAVQGLSYAVNGVQMSNFLYPEYFIENSDGPYDHLRILTAPFSIHPSGYASVMVIKDGFARRADRYGTGYPEWRKGDRPLARKNTRWSV